MNIRVHSQHALFDYGVTSRLARDYVCPLHDDRGTEVRHITGELHQLPLSECLQNKHLKQLDCKSSEESHSSSTSSIKGNTSEKFHNGGTRRIVKLVCHPFYKNPT